MSSRDIYSNLSPWDHRYSVREKEFSDLSRFFSEAAQISYQGRVELALVEELVARKICPQGAVEEIKKALDKLDPEEVYREEEKTRHNIRALVNVLAREVSPDYRPFIHLSATSMDIVDTANALRFKEAHRELIAPLLRQVILLFCSLTRREKATLQVGRTHGQHAVPITFGFALAQYLDRLGRAAEESLERSEQLCGKMAGAVGAYNASSMLVKDPLDLEKEVLKRLGLKPAPISTQIVPPEYMLNYLHSIIVAFGIIADFSDDMRHLQRSEIEEVGEFFAPDQVGSSTMPQKRNPINYEHIKSLWKTIQPRIQTVYMDQLSEHQRDLTNSASTRFYGDIPVGFFLALQRLKRVLEKFSTDQKAMLANLKKNQDFILAEPLYIALAAEGHPDAHEVVRKLTIEAEEKGLALHEILGEKKEIQLYLERMTPEQKKILKDPARYTGFAKKKAEIISEYWEKRMEEEKNGG